MRLIFLNRFFHPDHSATSRILSDLVFGLDGNEFEVHIITSRLRYDAPRNHLPANETIRGVDIRRVWTSSFGRLNLFGRGFDYMTFYVSASWALWRLARADDVIVAKTDPPMLSVIAAPIARLRGAKLVNWLQDVFPEVAQVIGTGRVPQFVYRLLRGLRDRSLKSASLNVVLGERMAERLTNFGVVPDRIRIIANFADGATIRPVDPAANKLRMAWGLSDKFVVSHSGNLGRVHEYGTLLAAMEHLGDRQLTAVGNAVPPTSIDQHPTSSHDVASPVPDIAWLFIGGGALYVELKREATQRQLVGTRFEPYQPDHLLAESLSAADVHIVSLRPALEGLVVPSKFYGIAAAGRATIYIGDPDGELARLIAYHRCGCTVPVGDGAALSCAIRALAADPQACRAMGARARAAFEAEFDKQLAIARWEELLREIGGC